MRFIQYTVDIDLEDIQEEILEYVKENKKEFMSDLCPELNAIQNYINGEMRNKALYENPSQDLKEAYEKLDRLLFYEGK